MATEAVLETLRQLWVVLRQNNVVAAVVGGLALATWRHPRTTLDVDVLLLGEGAQLSKLLQSLQRAQFTRKRDQIVALGETDLLQFMYRPEGFYVDVQVDLLLAKSAFTRDALRRSVTLISEALGFEVQVLGCEDLILMKLLAGRIIDRADAAGLLRANRTVVDENLLNSLAARLNLASALADIQREAFG